MGGYKNSITDIDDKIGIGEPNPTQKLHISGGHLLVNNGNTAEIYLRDTSNYLYGDLNGVINVSAGNNLRLRTNGSERMRIDSSGRVGIGISSITANANADDLQIGDGTGGNRGLTITAQNNSGAAIYFGDGDDTDIGSIRYDNSNNSMKFFTNTTEAMRITSGGDVLIGTQTTALDQQGFVHFNTGRFSCTDDDVVVGILNRKTSNGEILRFAKDQVDVGSIDVTGTSTSYNTSSDYRLKENVVEMTGALDRVDALKPSRFNFIADPEKTVDGFLAHEVQAIVPEAVTGEKDAMEEYEVTPAEYETVIIQEAVEATYDEEGNELTPAQEAITEQRLVSEAVMGTRPVYQGIDQSKLVPLLVGAIQELRAEIEALKQNSVS